MTSVQIFIDSKPSTLPPPTPPVQLYQHKEDKEVFGYIRSCAPCPAVFVMLDDQHNYFGRQWQYYLVAINYAMTLENVMLLLDYRLAFANRTGLRNPSDPRNDYITQATYSPAYKDPQLDKVRTTSRSVLTGTETYSILQAMKDTADVLKARYVSGKGSLQLVRHSLTANNTLIVKTFDSTKPPPLKEGRVYPQRIEDINPDDYLYSPRYNREMFLTANIVARDGAVVQFPRGALYSWTNDNAPYSFMPHISNPGYGAITRPLKFLNKVPLGSPVPSPYRHV